MINTWRTAPRNCFSGGYTGAPVQPMSREDRAFWRLRAMPQAARAATATRLSLAARVFGLARIAIAKGGAQ